MSPIQAYLCGQPLNTDFAPKQFFKAATAGVLGVIKGRNVWSDEENKILEEHYPSKGVEGCSELLPDRSMQAIVVQASKRGVSGTYHKVSLRAPWTDLEDAIVRLHPGKPLKAVAELAQAGYDRSWAATCQRMQKLKNGLN